MNLDTAKYEVVIMHEDDTNERRQFNSLAEAVKFMDEVGEPTVCLPYEPEEPLVCGICGRHAYVTETATSYEAICANALCPTQPHVLATIETAGDGFKKSAQDAWKYRCNELKQELTPNG